MRIYQGWVGVYSQVLIRAGDLLVEGIIPGIQHKMEIYQVSVKGIIKGILGQNWNIQIYWLRGGDDISISQFTIIPVYYSLFHGIMFQHVCGFPPCLYNNTMFYTCKDCKFLIYAGILASRNTLLTRNNMITYQF